MARLLRPVTKIISVMPAAAASSTAYWMSGLSTIGSISFGLALVTGRKRLPSPATGNTALMILPKAMGSTPFRSSSTAATIDGRLELSFVDDRHAKLVGALEL